MVLDHIGKNDYRLDIPPHLRIHGILKVNNMKLFEPLLLEDIVSLLHPVENILYFQHPLFIDQIMDNKAKETY